MQVIFALAKAGHQQHVPEISERLRHERGYIPGTCAHSPFLLFQDIISFKWLDHSLFFKLF